MRLWHLLVWINRLLWFCVLAVMVVAAATVSLGRYYAGYVEHYQDEILAMARERSGLDLEATRLRADWSRWSPVLRARGVSLGHPREPGREVLRADKVTVRLDLLSSLLALAPRVGVVEVGGLDLALEEVRLGYWRLAGFDGDGDTPSLDAVLDALLEVDLLRVEDARLRLRFVGGGEVDLQGRELALERAGHFRRLGLSLAFSDGGAPLEVLIESRGDPREAGFRALAHASFTEVDLTPILPAVEAFGLTLEQGLVDGQLWLQWLDEQAFTLRGDIRIPNLDLAGLSGQSLPAVRDLALQFHLQQTAAGWRAWLPQLDLELGGQALALHDLEVSGSGLQRLHLATRQLALEPLQHAVRGSGLLQGLAATALETLNPRGDIANLHLEIRPGAEPGERFHLRAELQGVDVEPWRGAPGATGLLGYAELGPQAGWVELDTGATQLAFPGVYRTPLAFSALRGRVDWSVQKDAVRVHSGTLVAEGEAGIGRARLGLDLPLGPSEQQPEMTLAIGMRDTHARYRDQFLPYLLPPNLLQWLATAVGDARVPEVAFIYRGELGASPLGNTVQVGFEVEDGALDYHGDWPALSGIHARGLVSDDQLWVDATEARTLTHAELRDIEVQMSPRAGGPWLQASASVAMRDEDLPGLLAQPGMRQLVGAAFEDWRWQGAINGSLDLGLPLGGGAPEVRVQAGVEPGRLQITPLNLTLEQVSGSLSYDTARGLNASDLRARLFQRPVRAQVGMRDGVQRVTASTTVAATDVRDWLDLPLLAPLQGEAVVHMLIELPGQGDTERAPRLSLDSDLRGIGIDLPFPLGKAAKESAALSVVLPLAGGPDRDLQLSLEDRLGMRMRWGGDEPAFAFQLGRSEVPELQPGRILVTGALSEVSVADWQAAQARHGEALAQPGRLDTELPLLLRDLSIAQLNVADQQLHDLIINGSVNQGRWRLRVAGRELAGRLRISVDDPVPSLRLDTLRLQPGLLTSEGDGLVSMEPPRVIDLDVTVGELFWGEELLGGIGFELRRLPDGLRLQQVSGNLRDISIAGREDERGASLEWREGASGPYTRFEGRLLAGDLSEVLASWGYEEILVSRRGRADLDFDWPGGPAEFRIAGVSGELLMRIEDGRFMRAPATTTGALRVVGVFNLANLLRRLRLDFSDIFGAGVSFNRLDGDLVFDHGRVITRTPLAITSPSTGFRASGELDFNTDQVDLELAATLPIASNLPWVAAIAGGLPAAAGVYLMSRVFQSQVDRYSSAIYRISGDWHDPQVEFLRVFDPADGEASQ